MILPDVNLLIYAYNSDAPRHARAKDWWEECMSAARPVGLPWPVVVGFLRLVTSRAVLAAPFPAAEATEVAAAWLARPHVMLLSPGPRHFDILAGFIGDGAMGALVTDAHLAAFAVENGAELQTNDGDFARFSGLRWRNPIA